MRSIRQPVGRYSPLVGPSPSQEHPRGRATGPILCRPFGPFFVLRSCFKRGAMRLLSPFFFASSLVRTSVQGQILALRSRFEGAREEPPKEEGRGTFPLFYVCRCVPVCVTFSSRDKLPLREPFTINGFTVVHRGTCLMPLSVNGFTGAGFRGLLTLAAPGRAG